MMKETSYFSIIQLQLNMFCVPKKFKNKIVIYIYFIKYIFIELNSNWILNIYSLLNVINNVEELFKYSKFIYKLLFNFQVFF